MNVSYFMLCGGEFGLLSDTINILKNSVRNIDTISVTIDAKFWDIFDKQTIPDHLSDVSFFKGCYHGSSKAPYRNVVRALYNASKITNMSSDWYVYLEPDVLIVNDDFYQDLDQSKYLIATDVRDLGQYKNEYLEKILDMPDDINYKNILGCFVCYNKTFVEKLYEFDFFNRFIENTEGFKLGHFPDFYGYAFEETLMPTLASWLGGEESIVSLARYSAPRHSWNAGNFARYLVRFGAEIDITEIGKSASIIHPLKMNMSAVRRRFFRTRCHEDLKPKDVFK